MRIQSAQEALFVACEMETGAVQLYDRALTLMEEAGRQGEPLAESLRLMRADEQRHLQQFRSLYTGLDAQAERVLMLSAVAAGVLLEGGLMGAVRLGLLESVESMLRFAGEQEAKAVEVYRLFAKESQDAQAKAALLSIAAEEELHLADIRLKMKSIEVMI